LPATFRIHAKVTQSDDIGDNDKDDDDDRMKDERVAHQGRRQWACQDNKGCRGSLAFYNTGIGCST